MAVIIIFFKFSRFKQGSIVVNPVHSLFVYHRDKHLVVRWWFKRGHYRLEHSLFSCELRTPDYSQTGLLKSARFEIKEAMGISIPKKTVDFKLMIYRLKYIKIIRNTLLLFCWQAVVLFYFILNIQCLLARLSKSLKVNSNCRLSLTRRTSSNQHT